MARRTSSGLENLSLPGKLAVGLVFVVLVGVAYFILFYSEIDGEIASAHQTREAKKRELADAQEAKKAYNRDIAEKTRREQLARKQKKILPDDAESPAFLSTVQTVATISGVKLVSWGAPGKGVPQQFYAKVPMELKLEGKFHQIAKFFHGVGQVDRIINVENIVMAIPPGTKDREQEQILRVDCLATAFRALRPGENEKSAKGKGKRK